MPIDLYVTSSANGFMFEAEFYENCKHGMIVSSCSMDGNETTLLSFNISHVEQPLGCLAVQMRKNELYELRVLHSTIDGVGYLREEGSHEDWYIC